MQDKISIIIPVYNGELYLSQCIDSILKQTYTNFEIIIINDGSTDSTNNIIHKYQKTDPRIINFYEINQGVSAARNCGIELASGKYITFIDADDEIEKTYLERAIYGFDCLKKDFVEVGYLNDVKDKQLEYQTIDKNKSILRFLQGDGYVWGKFFLTENIKKNNIKFLPDIKVCEDLVFVIQYFFSTCNETLIYYKNLYYYNKYDNSCSNSKANYLNLKTRLEAFYIVHQYLVNYGNRDLQIEFAKIYSKNMIWVTLDYFKWLDIYKRKISKQEIESIFKYWNDIKNLVDIQKRIEIEGIQYFPKLFFILWKIQHNIKINE